MRQYAVKSGQVVLDNNVCKTRKKAEEYLAALEEADRVYDIPNTTRRVIVWREVTPWIEYKDKKHG